MQMRMNDVRTMLWHLRNSGVNGVKNWRLREAADSISAPPENVKGAEGGWVGFWRNKRLSFAPAIASERQPRRGEIRAAVILDEFSSEAFKYEWELLYLKKNGWQQQLENHPVDLLFVESAWKGNNAEWQYQLAGTSGPKQPFIELVEWCRASNIPTVFWNKEDPPHYDDFLPAARLFDYVFTSDSAKIPEYTRDLGHNRVDVLSFAAQPAIHNPVRPRHGWHSRDVAFAGMYFAHKYPERRNQMDFLLGGAVDASDKMRTGLEIFSRQLGGDTNYQFPSPLDSRVVGSLTYAQMLTAYKAYKVFLNVNSVTDSPSMCARRVFEITASGTPVLSAPSSAIPNFFSQDQVIIASSREESSDISRALVRNPELNERIVHTGQRTIWQNHTYAHRAEAVLTAALPSLARPIQQPTVSALVSTIRPQQLDHIFRTMASQKGVDLEMVLLSHGFEITREQIDSLKAKHGFTNVILLSATSDITLGECLKRCVEAASGDVLTKMDDDDYYGPNYLSDQLFALSYSGAQVVGKQAHYMYLASRDVTVLRNSFKEHRFTRLVMGPTIMASRRVFLDTPFRTLGTGEDTAFLNDVIAASGSIYSADRYNFCQYRSKNNHTWSISDNFLLASSDVKFFGNPEDHISI